MLPKIMHEMYYNPMHLAYEVVVKVPSFNYVTVNHSNIFSKKNEDGPHPITNNAQTSPKFKYVFMVNDEIMLEEDKSAIYMAYKQMLVDNLKARAVPDGVANMIASSALTQFKKYMAEQDKAVSSKITTTITPNWKFTSPYSHDEIKTSEITTEQIAALYEKIMSAKANHVLSDGSAGLFSSKSTQLPGVQTVVAMPCGCGNTFGPTEDRIWSIVQHLNDGHKWTREKIADWLDELHDSGQVNLEFEVETISDEEIESFVEGGES